MDPRSAGVELQLAGARRIVAVTGGKGEVEGSCMVQICTDNVCDRPRQHAFKVTVPEA